MILGCGIPKVILEGTQQDWIKLNTDYQYLRKFLAESELAPWFPHFDTLMALFVNMRNLAVGGEVEATTELKELWKRVIAFVPQGSGGQTVLGGWVRLLIPYSSKHLIRGLDKPIACLDINKPDPSKGEKYVSYDMQDKLAAYYLASGWSSVSTSLVDTPATLIDWNGNSYSVEFHSGFYPGYFDGSVVSTNLGYTMTENLTEKDDKEKEEFLAQGVVVEDKHFAKIPRALRHQASKIMKLFNVYGYNFFGVDPEEERQKQLYLDRGVVVDKKGYKLMIPNSLKEEESDIRKVFELEKYIKTEFI